MDTNVSLVRSHLTALQDLVRKHSAGGPDWRALRRAVTLCEQASDALDDDYCRAKLHVVSEYCAELFSSPEHGRWRRDSISGAVFLALQILNALELCSSRLYSLEATRLGARLGAQAGVAPYHELRP
jgi:hypothetical protein